VGEGKGKGRRNGKEKRGRRKDEKVRRENIIRRGEKRKQQRQGGVKGGIVGGKRIGRTRDGRWGRGRAETLKRFETGSRTVAHFDPSVGGERVTVRALASAEDSWVLVAREHPGEMRRKKEERKAKREGERERDRERRKSASTLLEDIL